MSCLQDSYDYESYDLGMYQHSKGPPLIEKKSRLIATVVQDQVDILRDLLDSPKWYNVTDQDGYNLLQIAILRDNQEVFDYIMSLPNFPLEFVSEYGGTALDIVHSRCNRNEYFEDHRKQMSEHFAYELILKVACMNHEWFDFSTPLCWAIGRSYFFVAMLLIETGADVNDPNDVGDTPLSLALNLQGHGDMSEVVTALLIHGADPSYEHFGMSVLHDAPRVVQESLFLYLCHDDEYSKLKIDWDVLIGFAIRRSPLFFEIRTKFPIRVSDVSGDNAFTYLSSMSFHYLKVVIQKFWFWISQTFARTCYKNPHPGSFISEIIDVENLNVMLESTTKSDMITIITILNSSQMFGDLIFRRRSYEPTIKELYCFLLSYGLNIHEMDLQLVYKKFGYCELFKILLHMDIKMDVGISKEKNVMAVFIYDVSMNLEKFFARPYNYERIECIKELFSYFAHPKLREMYYRLSGDQEPRNDVPRIPLLVELSRNAFRDFFVAKFEIKTSKQFFTLLNSLPISRIFKEIIAYEKKLYHYSSLKLPLPIC